MANAPKIEASASSAGRKGAEGSGAPTAAGAFAPKAPEMSRLSSCNRPPETVSRTNGT